MFTDQPLAQKNFYETMDVSETSESRRVPALSSLREQMSSRLQQDCAGTGFVAQSMKLELVAKKVYLRTARKKPHETDLTAGVVTPWLAGFRERGTKSYKLLPCQIFRSFAGKSARKSRRPASLRTSTTEGLKAWSRLVPDFSNFRVAEGHTQSFAEEIGQKIAAAGLTAKWIVDSGSGKPRTKPCDENRPPCEQKVKKLLKFEPPSIKKTLGVTNPKQTLGNRKHFTFGRTDAENSMAQTPEKCWIDLKAEESIPSRSKKKKKKHSSSEPTVSRNNDHGLYKKRMMFTEDQALAQKDFYETMDVSETSKIDVFGGNFTSQWYDFFINLKRLKIFFKRTTTKPEHYMRSGNFGIKASIMSLRNHGDLLSMRISIWKEKGLQDVDYQSRKEPYRHYRFQWLILRKTPFSIHRLLFYPMRPMYFYRPDRMPHPHASSQYFYSNGIRPHYEQKVKKILRIEPPSIKKTSSVTNRKQTLQNKKQFTFGRTDAENSMAQTREKCWIDLNAEEFIPSGSKKKKRSSRLVGSMQTPPPTEDSGPLQESSEQDNLTSPKEETPAETNKKNMKTSLVFEE
ncbi:unnamed protein product [Caenorhabditis auriculariae]|uniref:Uncharacterized protein n=1 Tax=Caenorhabditis auriculariae TaxID=2777116 RepID=A0A8S1H0E8_9PELO|nr:unnamed protein product [Caenorhabditis auriculariae]